MRIFIAFIAILAAYLAYQQYDGKKRQNAFNELVISIDQQPVNQFELKHSLNTQVKAKCQSLGNQDADIEKMNDCLNTISAFQDECELQIFRLAPVEFESSRDAVDYGKRYQRCVFNSQFSNLIDVPKLL